MLTPEENARHRAYFAAFMGQCAAYKTLLAEAGLPLSVSVDELTAAYRQQLFDGLLKADKGLQARYDLLRTDEGRQKLIADTINLDGYDVIDEATARLRQLATTWAQLERGGLGVDVPGIPLESFARYYELDLGKLLDDHTLSWEGYEHVLAHFEALAQALTPWARIVRTTIQSGAGMQHVGMALADYFTLNGPGLASDPVQVNVKVLHARMKTQKLDFHLPRT